MGDQGSQLNQQNTNQADQKRQSDDTNYSLVQPQSQVGHESQISHQNYSQANQSSQLEQSKFDSRAHPYRQSNVEQYSQLSQNNYEEINSNHTNSNRDRKKEEKLNFTDDGQLVSPLVGTIKRGSIGGTGEKGLTQSVIPPAVENTPFMGKKGGGKIPLVGEIRRGSISGLGERGFATSYVGKDEVPLKATRYGSLGMHRPKEKDKYNLRKKSKKNVAISGSKFGRGKNAYYMRLQNMGVSNAKKVSNKSYLGMGKGPSIIGYVNTSSVEEKHGMVGSLVRSSNGMPKTNINGSNISGSHFVGSNVMAGGGGGEERSSDQRGPSGAEGSKPRKRRSNI